MRNTLRFKYVAAAIHAFLFISLWVLYAIFSQPIADGPSSLPFVILLIADLPISFIAFGVLLTSVKMGPLAALLWGILGTFWWFALGHAIDTLIRRSRENRATGGWLFHAADSADPVPTHSRRKELIIAGSVVAVLVISSLAWSWNGWQGHFDKGEISSFNFAPDGRSVLLVRSQGDSSRIEKVSLGSSRSDPITKNLSCTASSPTYSPDETRIAFACETKLTELSQILVMDANGGNLHPLFSSISDNYDFAPHFTPDGMEIYFGRMPNFDKDPGSGGAPPRKWDLCSATLDGKNVRQLTSRNFEDFGVTFSGDRRKFALSGDVTSGTRLNLYSLDDPSKAASMIQPLVPNSPPQHIISNVAISSDAQSIYYMGATDGKKAFDYDVYRMDLANNAVVKFTNGNGYATDLSVSSDGKMAVFLRWTSRWGSLPNLARLYSLDLATKQVVPLNLTGMR